jgi:hypothetical protein
MLDVHLLLVACCWLLFLLTHNSITLTEFFYVPKEQQ